MDITRLKKVGAVVGISLVGLVVLAGGVSAMPVSFWDRVADRAGDVLGKVLGAKIQAPVQAQVTLAQVDTDGDGLVGTGNSSLRSSVQKADVCSVSSNTSTGKVQCSLLNDEPAGVSSTRYITRATVILDNTAASTDLNVNQAIVNRCFDLATSTGPFATSTQGGRELFTCRDTIFSTSTQPLVWATSTEKDNRNVSSTPSIIWRRGEYLNLGVSHSGVSTTAGLVKVQYDVAP